MVLLLFALILKIGIMLIWFKNRPMRVLCVCTRPGSSERSPLPCPYSFSSPASNPGTAGVSFLCLLPSFFMNIQIHLLSLPCFCLKDRSVPSCL